MVYAVRFAGPQVPEGIVVQVAIEVADTDLAKVAGLEVVEKDWGIPASAITTSDIRLLSRMPGQHTIH